jgi:hypothetical protein
VRLERLGILKKSTSSGFEPATIRLVAQCLKQLRYRVPYRYIKKLKGTTPTGKKAPYYTAFTIKPDK